MEAAQAVRLEVAHDGVEDVRRRSRRAERGQGRARLVEGEERHAAHEEHGQKRELGACQSFLAVRSFNRS